MSMKTRLVKLEKQRGELVLIVAGTEESTEQALQRWCDEHQQPAPERILFVITGVNRIGRP